MGNDYFSKLAIQMLDHYHKMIQKDPSMGLSPMEFVKKDYADFLNMLGWRSQDLINQSLQQAIGQSGAANTVQDKRNQEDSLAQYR